MTDSVSLLEYRDYFNHYPYVLQCLPIYYEYGYITGILFSFRRLEMLPYVFHAHM
jgi:hypothetical protein